MGIMEKEKSGLRRYTERKRSKLRQSLAKFKKVLNISSSTLLYPISIPTSHYSFLDFFYNSSDFQIISLSSRSIPVGLLSIYQKMHGLKKSPLHWSARKKSVDPVAHSNSGSNPFDSDDESDKKQTVKPSRRISSEPSAATPNLSTNLFDDDEIKETPSRAYSTSTARNKYNNDFQESGGFENQTVEELENYGVYRSEETTKSVNSCLKIAQDMREDATKTLITLHQQGEQITRTHMTAADIDHDLSRGEKLLGSLGGIFSKTWKPKTNRPITGPVITRMSDDPVQRRGNHLEQREKLGLSSAPKARSSSRTPPPEPTNALQKVEAEKAKQDDGLSDISDLLGELKNMAVDMGSEIERQNKALDHTEKDVDELGFRVQGANRRIRRLLGK